MHAVAAGPSTHDPQPVTSVDGDPPWFPNLAEVMDPAPKLLDELVGRAISWS